MRACKWRNRRVSLVVAALWLLTSLAAGPSASAQGTGGVISGQVWNVTTETPVDAGTVELWRWDEDGPVQLASTMVDASGNFRLENVDASADNLYQLQMVYQEVAYLSDSVVFAEGETTTTTQIAVYETTPNPDEVVIDRFHFVILAQTAGQLTLLEVYQFTNNGPLTYVGTEDTDGQPRTVTIDLPVGATNVKLENAQLTGAVEWRDDQVVTGLPIRPGPNGLDLAFSYRLDYQGNSLTINRPLPYDTGSISGLLLDQGITLSSPSLTAGGTMEAGGGTYLQFEGGDLKGGDSLVLNLAHLDEARVSQDAAAEPEVAPEVMPSAVVSGQQIVRWPVLGLGLLLVAGAFVFAATRGRAVVVPDNGVEEQPGERTQLLRLLAQLDDAYAAGLLDDAVYERLRQQHKARLRAIWPRPTGPREGP